MDHKNGFIFFDINKNAIIIAAKPPQPALESVRTKGMIINAVKIRRIIDSILQF